MQNIAAQAKNLIHRHVVASFAARSTVQTWNALSVAPTGYMWHGQLEGGSA